MSKGTLVARPPRPNQSVELVGFAVIGSSIRLQSRSAKSVSRLPPRPRTVTGDRFCYVNTRDKNEGIGARRIQNSAHCLSAKRPVLYRYRRPIPPREPLVMSTMSLPRFSNEATQGMSEDPTRLQADACSLIPRSIKSNTSSQQTADAQYLQETYDYIFQKHANTLNGVISRHLANKVDQPDNNSSNADIPIIPSVHAIDTSSCSECENSDLDPEGLPCKKSQEGSSANSRCGVCDNCRAVAERNHHRYQEQDATNKPPSVQVTRKNGVPPKLVSKLEGLSLTDNAPRPVITFSHVDGEGRLERGEQPRSRSPSPLLEVPSPSDLCKEIMRPPIN